MTFRLRLLGAVGLIDGDGREVRAVLAQPKRLALLVYLAAARPAGFHRRDTLLGIFWPDFDEAAARASLSRAIHYLRQALGPEALVGRGEQELAVDRAQLTCDLFELDEALARGDGSAALSIYQGDLLPGFQADDAAAFNDWLDGERERLRTVMGKSAAAAARAAEHTGDLGAAVALQRRASALAPYGEPVVADLMRFLEAQGNRAEALLAYEEFVRRYRADLDAAPSAELHALADRLRQSRGGPALFAPPPARSDHPQPPDPRRSADPIHRSTGRTASTGAALRLVDDHAPAPAPEPSPSPIRQPISLAGALAIYVCAFGTVALLARAAMVGIGLPDWTLPGVLIVMALGLPLTLLTAFVQRDHQRAGRTAALAFKAKRYLSWQRTARGGAFALGGFVLLVSGFMGFRAAGIGPFGSLVAAGRVPAGAPILVTDFTVRGADTSLAGVLSYLTRASFARSSAVRVVSAARAGMVLVTMGKPATTRIDLATAQAIAARGGVPVIAEGEVAALDSEFIVVVHLIAAASGEELASAGATGTGAKGLIDAVDNVTRDLRGRLGESFLRVRNTPRLYAVTTPSLAALHDYTDGHHANDLELNFGLAETRLREAVIIDPNFASAWELLAAVLQNSGRGRQSEVDSALQRAFVLRAALPDIERTFIEGDYYAHGPGRDRARAIAIYQAKVDNGETGAINNLALLYESRRDFGVAEALLRARAREDSSLLLRSNLAYELINRGDWRGADSMAQIIERAAPNRRGMLALALELLYGQGAYDALARVIDTVRAVPDSSRWKEAAAWRWRLALLHGRVSVWALGQHRSIDGAINAALVDAWPRGRPGDGTRRLDSLLAGIRLDTFPATNRPDLEIATVYAIDGAADRARAVLAKYQAQVTDTSLVRVLAPEVHTVLGEIALAEHHPLDAIREFRTGDRAPDGPVDACSACLPLALGRAFDAAGMRDSAITMFEQYLAVPGVLGALPGDRYLMEPFVHFQLGDLYAASGRTSDAFRHYNAFVTLYHDADREIQPKVAEARQRIATLRKSAGVPGQEG